MSTEELNARDLAIEEQLNFLSKQAAPKELANKPLKIKSDITRDMVEDFKAEQQGSIFHPPSVLPVLETFHPIAVPEKERIDEDKDVYLKRIADYDREIALRIDAIPQVKEGYNAFMEQLQVKALNARRAGVSAPQLLKDIEDEKQNARESFDLIMEQLNREIAEFQAFKNIADAQLNRLDKVLGRADELKQQNEGEKARVERLNKQAIKTFEDEINALNKGININQQVGESEADYLQRIENMKGARYGQDMVIQAGTFNIKRFKTRMKEIMEIPEHKLEKIIKYLEKDNLLYEANKKFPLIKSAIAKTYGVSPRFTKAGDEDDLYMFIYNTLTRQFQEEEKPKEAIVVATKNSDLIAKSKTGFIPKSKLLVIYRNITGKKSFAGTSTALVNEIIRLREKDESVAESVTRTSYKGTTPFAFTREQPEQDLGGFPQPKKKGRPTKEEAEYKKLLKAGEQAKKQGEAQAFLSGIAQSAKSVSPNLLRVMKEYERRQAEGIFDEPPQEDIPRKGKVQTKIPFAKGKGVEREFYPKLVPFGAIMISPAQLFYYKVLRVREPTKHSIRGMPDVRVSEDMVHILMKIINGATPSMTELKALGDDEKTIYDAIIMKAKLHKEMPNTYEQSLEASINKLKKRLELCEGEWNAGNDNTKIKKELNSIIRQLTELKAITEKEGRIYLKQF